MRSPVNAMDIRMVKKTWDWTSREAIPGVMSRCIAQYRTPNCPTPSRTPKAASRLQGTAGRRNSRTQGSTDSRKRRAANRNGGKSASAHLMTTKFVPQMKTTDNANNKWDRGMMRGQGRGAPALDWMQGIGRMGRISRAPAGWPVHPPPWSMDARANGLPVLRARTGRRPRTLRRRPAYRR
ncbi:Uncharacterised protein [Bordetella pertussis]|nr:Uncharacterised protein [Bordetella pertussis]